MMRVVFLPIIGMTPRIIEILERFVREKENGSDRADDHDRQQHSATLQTGDSSADSLVVVKCERQ